MEGHELAQRIQVLEDIEAIKKLKAKYCYLADVAIAGDTSKWDEFLSLFAEDAKLDFWPGAQTETRDEMIKYFTEQVPTFMLFTAHMVHNPIIEVNGEQATGVWYVECPFTSTAEGRAGWIQGRYDEEYVKDRGQWKFRFIRCTFIYVTPFDEGWAKTRVWAPGLA